MDSNWCESLFWSQIQESTCIKLGSVAWKVHIDWILLNPRNWGGQHDVPDPVMFGNHQTSAMGLITNRKWEALWNLHMHPQPRTALTQHIYLEHSSACWLTLPKSQPLWRCGHLEKRAVPKLGWPQCLGLTDLDSIVSATPGVPPTKESIRSWFEVFSHWWKGLGVKQLEIHAWFLKPGKTGGWNLTSSFKKERKN